METVLFFLLGFGYIGLFIWGIRLSKNHGLFKLSSVVMLVIIGLIYDNFIIAFGSSFGEGKLLENLSYVRYWIHGLFTPTLILFAWNICMRAGLPWAKKTVWKIFAYLLTISLILLELLTSVRGLKLEATWKNGVLTYESVGQSGNPIMVITITIVLGIVGWILLRKSHFPWLLIGTIVMMVGGGLIIWLNWFVWMNVLEFLLIVSLLRTKQYQDKIETQKH